MKLELGGGDFSHGEGFLNMDLNPVADIIHDLEKFPYPFENDSVDELYSSHCIEHLEDPIQVLREIARICKLGAKVEIRVPHPGGHHAMCSGHKHVLSPMMIRNMDFHHAHLTWFGPKRLKHKSTNYGACELLHQAKEDLPFLAGLSDQVILQWIPGTCHESCFHFEVIENDNYKPQVESAHQLLTSRKSPIPRKPFTDKVTYNLVWGLQVYSDTWEHHCNELLEAIPDFNGQVIIGLLPGIDPSIEVLIKHHFISDKGSPGIIFTHPDKSQDLLTLVNGGDENSVTVFGQSIDTPDTSEAERLLTEFNYELLLFNKREVLKAMEQGYTTTGCFREFGNTQGSLGKSYYLGNTFAFRTHLLDTHSISSSEEDISDLIMEDVPPSHSHYLFMDNRKPLVDSTNWVDIINTQLEWESERLRTPYAINRVEQHARELIWFLKRIDGISSILIIGSRNGGLEQHIQMAIPECRTTSVDPFPNYSNTVSNLIIGDSSEESTRDEVRENGPFDVVFIDGDHTLEGVTADWEFARSLKPKKVFFHDISETIKHQLENCKVPILWREIKETYNTQEKCVGCGWGGIGEVLL